MSKMRKEYDPNKVKRRKRKTDCLYHLRRQKKQRHFYFKHFSFTKLPVDIIPIPSKHKAAEHLVNTQNP